MSAELKQFIRKIIKAWLLYILNTLNLVGLTLLSIGGFLLIAGFGGFAFCLYELENPDLKLSFFGYTFKAAHSHYFYIAALVGTLPLVGGWYIQMNNRQRINKKQGGHKCL
jgi:hypothetical protein